MADDKKTSSITTFDDGENSGFIIKGPATIKQPNGDVFTLKDHSVKVTYLGDGLGGGAGRSIKVEAIDAAGKPFAQMIAENGNGWSVSGGGVRNNGSLASVGITGVDAQGKPINRPLAPSEIVAALGGKEPGSEQIGWNKIVEGAGRMADSAQASLEQFAKLVEPKSLVKIASDTAGKIAQMTEAALGDLPSPRSVDKGQAKDATITAKAPPSNSR